MIKLIWNGNLLFVIEKGSNKENSHHEEAVILIS